MHVTTYSLGPAANMGGEPGVQVGQVDVYLAGDKVGRAESGSVTLTPDGCHVQLTDGRQVFATNSGLVLIDVLPQDTKKSSH